MNQQHCCLTCQWDFCNRKLEVLISGSLRKTLQHNINKLQTTNLDTDKQCSKLIHDKQQVKLMRFQNPIQIHENSLNNLIQKISVRLRNSQYVYN